MTKSATRAGRGGAFTFGVGRVTLLGAALLAGTLALSVPSAAARAKAAAVPPPKLATFLPAGFKATSVSSMNLNGAATPQKVVTAVATAPSAGSAGLLDSTVLVLAWDATTKSWTVAFDASKQPSYKTSTQQGVGTGLVKSAGKGPRVAAIHDAAGRSDLLFWLNSIGGDEGALLIGIVDMSGPDAALIYNYSGEEGQVTRYDEAGKGTIGATVIGRAPHQQVQVTLPWITAVDSISEAARLFSFVLGPVPNVAGYHVVSNNQPYVGVALSTYRGSSQGLVDYIEPDSPAMGKFQVGDDIIGVVGSSLPKRVDGGLLGPIAIEQVALYRPGQRVSFRIIRDERNKVVSLRLGQRSLQLGNLVAAPGSSSLYPVM